jgi:hypothetical protein
MHQWPLVEGGPIDYLMFVDETGDKGMPKDYASLVRLNVHPSFQAWPILCLFGVIFKWKEYQRIQNRFNTIKSKYWPPDGYRSIKQKYQKICFHSTDMAKRKDVFGEIDKKKWSNLDTEIWGAISNTDFKTICIIIDKRYPEQVAKIKYGNNIYSVATTLLLERFSQNTPEDAIIGINFESRGKKEDRRLLQHLKKITQDPESNGSFANKKDLDKIVALGWHPKRNCSGKVISGFELADMCARACGCKYLGRRSPFFHHIQNKILSYGWKEFPKKTVRDNVNSKRKQK